MNTNQITYEQKVERIMKLMEKNTFGLYEAFTKDLDELFEKYKKKQHQIISQSIKQLTNQCIDYATIQLPENIF